MGFQLCRKIIELSLQLKEFCVLVNLCVYELLVLFHEGDNVVCVYLYFFCEVDKQIHAQLVFERVHILAKSLERERCSHNQQTFVFVDSWMKCCDTWDVCDRKKISTLQDQSHRNTLMLSNMLIDERIRNFE